MLWTFLGNGEPPRIAAVCRVGASAPYPGLTRHRAVQQAVEIGRSEGGMAVLEPDARAGTRQVLPALARRNPTPPGDLCHGFLIYFPPLKGGIL